MIMTWTLLEVSGHRKENHVPTERMASTAKINRCDMRTNKRARYQYGFKVPTYTYIYLGNTKLHLFIRKNCKIRNLSSFPM